ncbi:hypothetical protein HRbin19_00982 [bacterium HR19]|nr:hypothetical protein HRbin19_00982 [bacterium HR19]
MNKIVKVKKVFVYDEDGIFKDVPLKRYEAIFSLFLTKDEKISFLIRGRVPEKVKSILKNVGFKTDLKENFCGISLYVHVDETRRLNFARGNELCIFPNSLILMRAPRRIFSLLCSEKELYGDKEILDFFLL